MATSLPDYVMKRVRREPSCSCIVKGSTPVVAFGDPRKAFAATLGLNPSRVEFQDGCARLLDGEERRLATLDSLGLRCLPNATKRHVESILKDCENYFHRNPYRRWFDQLEPLLNAMGASYYDATACHLDLVQWATDPTWGKLSPADRKLMLSEDVLFLIEQLRNEQIELLLLNGMGVVRQFQRHLDVVLSEASPIDHGGYQPTRLFTGVLFGHVQVVGWSTNIQSSFGVTRERRKQLVERIRVSGRHLREK
ncbi:MAG: hypothetical protein U9N87_00575 [Planctomycetota bacterium]|nr:hypothetical protein [Planctomycetota bacterium]